MNAHHITTEESTVVDYKTLAVSSPSFTENGIIPAKFTCDGEDINPSLDIKGIPVEANCLALVVEDPDAATGIWVHWVVWNIPVTHHIKENHKPGVEGINDFGTNRYQGPCPPGGLHRYFFKVYALDSLLDLHANTDKFHLEKAMSGHILGFGETIGHYTRKKN